MKDRIEEKRNIGGTLTRGETASRYVFGRQEERREEMPGSREREQVGVALDEMNCRMNVPEPIPTTTKSAMSIYINYAQRASITPS